MSEAPWQSRANVLPLLRPEVMIGAASPLWGYFTGAALAGVGWWWMTRWATMRPVELEAVAAAVVEPAAEALAEVVGGPVAEALVTDETPALPVGGEAAPIGAATLEAELIAEPELAKELKRPPAPRSRKPREGEPKPH
jgi:hypothetical protein